LLAIVISNILTNSIRSSLYNSVNLQHLPLILIFFSIDAIDFEVSIFLSIWIELLLVIIFHSSGSVVIELGMSHGHLLLEDSHLLMLDLAVLPTESVVEEVVFTWGLEPLSRSKITCEQATCYGNTKSKSKRC
jgi:hypothetical protein